MIRTIAAMAVGLAVLAACEETMTATTEDVDSGLPSPAQSNCMAAVANEAGDGNVTVLSAVGSGGGGTEVIIGVGQDRTPWRCLADRDGNVERVMSAVDEAVL